jgi:hypothetical protein
MQFAYPMLNDNSNHLCIHISSAWSNWNGDALGLQLSTISDSPLNLVLPGVCEVDSFLYLSELLVGTVWEGLLIIQGGYFTAVLLFCIVGNLFTNMHNPIPKSSDITVQQLIGMLIYFFAAMPLISIPPTKIRIIYTIKSIALPPVVIGLFIFYMLKG